MKYLDFHQHYGMMDSPLNIKKVKISYNSEELKEIYEKEILKNCKKFNMVVAVNGCGYAGKARFINRNDEVEAFFKKYPDYIIGVGYIDLDYDNPNYLDTLYKKGFKAIKVIWPNERYDSDKYYEFYKRCQY